jgi:hypothetical protein
MSIVKLNNRGVRSATAFGSITGLGSMVFIKKQTASSSSTISFVDGTSDVVLDNTYKEYLFTFNNIHPATDNASFSVNFSTDGGSNYNVTKTTTYFRAIHWENDTSAFGYDTGGDLAQSTDFQNIITVIGADNDQSGVGYMHLFNPSNTTFVKHFIVNAQKAHYLDISVNEYYAGYANTTSAIDAVQFKMSSGNIDAGDICLYGIA